uniref:Uncharacterized protein n=1 Tax=Chromera velia CCMP2878 TaxID=1169474 RepID=A0A0G4FGG1_9ALVE|mmetsp:Transcript_51732/g.101398  ORF Transcript_51732/g.101398 Transcript_51732/m.101398 type:complete len:128 (-) Transcript_51732:349-732(-)|eukprot:Cvel_16712.t1-p1 / transcript=Cvel_16712.t1 / gene=Cvel_16712 / organism=Chromera_velia_CCMP2878 / gene_product=hypothetical protein / transcript_product=hypothetical protein / location=Cvel_scaffold1298:45991-46371(+) / protein_length=127 / sequence_SO=supercontig / SO=protein_coding / is_pseudo=false
MRVLLAFLCIAAASITSADKICAYDQADCAGTESCETLPSCSSVGATDSNKYSTKYELDGDDLKICFHSGTLTCDASDQVCLTTTVSKDKCVTGSDGDSSYKVTSNAYGMAASLTLLLAVFGLHLSR